MHRTLTLSRGLFAALLLFPLPALAQSSFVGDWSLGGKMGHRSTSVKLKISADAAGKLTVRRTGRLTSRSFRSTPAFTWTSNRTRRVGSSLRVDFYVRRHVGMSGALGASQGAQRYRFRAYYRVRADGQLREYVRNLRRVGDHTFWRTARTRGAQAGDDLSRLLETLRVLGDDLWYISESDALLTPRAWKGKGDLDLAGFRKLLGVEATRPSEEADFGSFYDRLTTPWDDEDADEVKEAKRFKLLLDTFSKPLTNVRMYRIGDPDSILSSGSILGGIRVFIVGKDAQGNLVCLETFAAET